PAAAAFDLDSDFTGGSLTVQVIDNAGDPAASQDSVSVRDFGLSPNQIGVSGSYIKYGSQVVGTFSGGSGATALSILITASLDGHMLDSLLRSIQYANPSPQSYRKFRFTLNDGEGGTVYADTKIGIGCYGTVETVLVIDRSGSMALDNRIQAA